MRENFQHALDGAVLARPAVQHVERDVGFSVGQHGRDVAADIDAGDAKSCRSSASAQALPERSETSRSADQPPIRTATCLVTHEPLRSCQSWRSHGRRGSSLTFGGSIRACS